MNEENPTSDFVISEDAIRQELSGRSDAPGDHRAAARQIILPDQILPPHLFILPVNNACIFPTLMAPLIVSDERYIRTVEEAISKNKMLGLIMVRGEKEVRADTTFEDMYRVGTVVKVLKRIKLPDGSINVLVNSLKRFRIKHELSNNPFLVVEPEYLTEIVEKGLEMDALSRTVISQVKKLSEVNPFFTEEMKLAMINAPAQGNVADIVAFALSLPKEESQDFLETVSVKERFEKLLLHLKKEQEVADLQKKIQDEVNDKINTMQREYFLKEQLKAIKRELGHEEDGREKALKDYRTRIKKAEMPPSVRKVADEELSRLESMAEQSPEYGMARNYLDLLCDLPWNKYSEDILDISRARKILDEDHFGLERVKDRIIEFLAVRYLSEQSQKSATKRTTGNDPNQANKAKKKGSIICLVGPPGVGKTSVGRSIARTLGRNFYRFSLGGMRDEAEIKGHRRTYIGAMPGKVLQSIKRAGTKNPVIMLDEIDKLGISFQGDPASALLEVLDPEQNESFLDHYADVPFDLSDVLFIATANTTGSIPPPLLDRMEVIEIPGYTLEEKEQIAAQYVIPKVLAENGLRPHQVKIRKPALQRLMLDYAREPGLRTVQQLIAKIARKAAAQIVAASETKSNGKKSKAKSKPKDSSRAGIVIEADDLTKWLGPKRFYNEAAERIDRPGVVIGLAWTALGGDILFVEATEFPGTGKLKLTGQMGQVMSESAAIAWSFVKKTAAERIGVEREFFKERDFHLHIPAGAIPKDGPSAGITMASALYGLVTGKISRQRLAMTGELSLTGKVLPVGGIKEKLLAAKRSGVSAVILPEQNRKDLAEIPSYLLKGLKIEFVSRIEEVFDRVYQPAKANGASKRPTGKVSKTERKRILKTNGRLKKMPGRSSVRHRFVGNF